MKRILLGLFCTLSILGCSKQDQKTTDVSSNPKAEMVKNEYKNSGISIEDFRTNFNKEAEILNAPLIKAFDIQDNKKGFSTKLPSHLKILGSIDTFGNIDRLVVGLDISNISRDQVSDHSMMLGGLAITAFKAIDKNKIDESRDDVVQDTLEALFTDQKTLESFNSKTNFYGQYKFSASSDPLLGAIILSMEPK